MTYTADEIRQHRQLTLDSLRRTGPEHFDMDEWFSTPRFDEDDDSSRESFGLDDVECVDLGKCGTTACFAGHGASAWFASDPDEFDRHLNEAPPQHIVAHWLGLEIDTALPVASSMFSYTSWPLGMQHEVRRLMAADMDRDAAEWNVLVLWLSHEIEPNVKVPW